VHRQILDVHVFEKTLVDQGDPPETYTSRRRSQEYGPNGPALRIERIANAVQVLFDDSIVGLGISPDQSDRSTKAKHKYDGNDFENKRSKFVHG
jgi:hypothetical protein